MSKGFTSEWQRDLRGLGLYSGRIDDDFGPMTLKASRAVITAKPVKQKVKVADDALPPWMQEMLRYYGLHERRDNAALAKWLRGGKYLGDPSQLPWCGDGVETSIVNTLPNEKVPDNPFWAQGWRNFGQESKAIVGAIGVIRWSARSGHVGFVAQATSTRIKLLAGNQSNEINLTWFPRSKFIAFRWPANYPIKTYKPLTEAAAEAGYLQTR